MRYWWKLYEKMKNPEWEAKNSTLGETKINSSYEECRKFSCKDISRKTWCNLNMDSMIVEIPAGNEFHFIGRVATTNGNPNSSKEYYGAFRERDYISFSTISNKNISRYKGGVFYIYNILPDDIVHVFPLDSDLEKNAKTEREMTGLPSLWLSFDELDKLKNKFGAYDQVTCKTKRNGEILKPIAVIAFDKLEKDVLNASKNFGIPIVICHPDKDAINFQGDALYDSSVLNSASDYLVNKYNLDVRNMLYLD